MSCLAGLRAWLLLAVLAVAVVAGPASALEPREFPSAAQEERYRALLKELRCLVCQNQTLADSNADLAKDLRDEVYAMVTDGASDERIVDFLTARYGDFVLYRPPMTPKTWLLWFGPFALGAGALAFLIVQLRRRARSAGPERSLTDEEHRRAAELLARSPGGRISGGRADDEGTTEGRGSG